VADPSAPPGDDPFAELAAFLLEEETKRRCARKLISEGEHAASEPATTET
jgi:hypothetical protein